MSPAGDTVVVAAAVAQRPGRAGHAWVVRNWLGALRAAGYDAVFVDRIDDSLGDVAAGVGWVTAVMEGSDVPWAVLVPGATAGLGRRDLVDRCRDAVILDVMGYLDDPTLLGLAARRVLLDIDPGFGQAWQHNGSATMFADHDAYVTVGLNVGRPGCLVPDLGLDWVHTLPPVDLRQWPLEPPRVGGAFTTVATWRGPFAPVEVGGQRHGLRAHTARRFADLPARAGIDAEMALDIDTADDHDRRRLEDGGWRLVAPATVAADLHGYREYVRDSLAELSFAKEVYVSLRTGWFSDRSACYLATGRPVVTTDTGLADHLPVGEGLITFTTPDDAVDAVAAVHADPARHSKAARALAEEHLDGALVARRLMERVT